LILDESNGCWVNKSGEVVEIDVDEIEELEDSEDEVRIKMAFGLFVC
jgi:hypothetical protein